MKVMLIRHAEKPAVPPPPGGLTLSGQPDKKSLTKTGWKRAHKLVELFGGAQKGRRGGLTQPPYLFAADPDGRASKRPYETLMPLASHLGKPIVPQGPEIEGTGSRARFSQVPQLLLQRDSPEVVVTK